MIVVGLFDGNIAVYNLQKNTGTCFCNKFATNVSIGTGFCNKFATNLKTQESVFYNKFSTNVNTGTGFCNKLTTNFKNTGTCFCNKFATNVNSFSLDILSQAVHRRKSINLYCGPTGSALFIEYFHFSQYKQNNFRFSELSLAIKIGKNCET
jgi:hypothetical protein